jgi:hypothetical protein
LIAFVSVLGGWNYWYGDRYVTIETVPAEADLGLYYIRANFQKRFERGGAPARVRLPKRVDTTTRDHFSVRVSANGFSTTEKTYNVRKAPPKVLIKLEPLPNSLVAFVSTYIAGRTTFSFYTSEEPQFRISKSRGSSGFMLSLTKTADKLEEPPQVTEGLVRSVEVSQLGEDILIRVETREDELEIRTKQAYDPIREEHVFVLESMPKDLRPPTSDQLRRSLERAAFALDDPCDASFEAVLREALEPLRTASASRPSAGLAGLYRRELMLRLGRLDRGTVHTVAGEALRTGNPLELELALQNSLAVRGYIGLLGAFARTQDEPESVLRTLLAPQMPPEAFREAYGVAESAWEDCLN